MDSPWPQESGASRSIGRRGARKMKSMILFGVSFLSVAVADMTKVRFLDTRYKGERVRIDVFSNEQSLNYYTSPYLSGIVSEGVHVRFNNGQEGALFLDRKQGKIKFVCSDLNRYSYFSKDGTEVGSSSLQLPTSLTVDKEGNLFVIDYLNSRINYLKLDVAGKTYAHSDWNQKYLVAEQSHQMQFVTHVNDGGQKLVLAMNDIGRILVLNYDLSPVLDANGAPLVHMVSLPDFNGRKLKSDHLIENNIATFYSISRDPRERLDGSVSKEGWAEIKYDVAQKKFVSERYVEADRDDFVLHFVDIQPFYIPTPNGPRMHMFVLDANGSLHEFSESGALIKHVVKGVEDSDPRQPKPDPEIWDGFSMASCNDRRNYDVCRNLIVAEDFRHPGRGLIRYQYVPNPGDAYYVPLDVQMRENNTDGNLNQPDLTITNLSSIDVLSHFKVRFWMSREEMPPQTIEADKYYFNPDSIQMSVGVHPQNPNIMYVDLTFPESFELLPGQTTPDLGMRFGAHFRGYWPGVWTRSNDWSWSGIGPNYSSTKNVTIYDEDGNLIYGVEPNASSTPQPPVFTPARVFGFELLGDWSSPQAVLSENTATKTQGAASLQVAGGNWFTIESGPLKTLDITGETTHLAVDVYVPDNQPNPYWVGTVALVANCISAGVYNAYIGNVELTPLPRGQFSTLTFNIPTNVLAALQGDYSDFTIRFEISVAPNPPPLLFDNLRFTP